MARRRRRILPLPRGEVRWKGIVVHPTSMSNFRVEWARCVRGWLPTSCTRQGKRKSNRRSRQDGEEVAQFVGHLRRVVEGLRDFLFHKRAKLSAQPVNRHLHRALAHAE